jgi:hypothetical protein
MTDNDNVTVIDHSDVSFVPNRFFPQLGNELTVATATSLLKEFATCPYCEHDISPDTSGGVIVDRDAVWTEQTSERGAYKGVNRSNPHTCENCEKDMRLFVEEKARPSQWSKIPDSQSHWEEYHLWIKMENGNYFVTNPSHVSSIAIE